VQYLFYFFAEWSNFKPHAHSRGVEALFARSSNRIGVRSFIRTLLVLLCCFLGTFAKLRKSTVSFVMSVCSHWTDFHEISYWKMFRKSVKTFQDQFKSHKNNGYFTWRLMYICGSIFQDYS
jgi:hypothetical protein